MAAAKTDVFENLSHFTDPQLDDIRSFVRYHRDSHDTWNSFWVQGKKECMEEIKDFNKKERDKPNSDLPQFKEPNRYFFHL